MVKKISGTSDFGGKKAAPFKKGGGRDQDHPRTAKGELRERRKRK